MTKEHASPVSFSLPVSVAECQTDANIATYRIRRRTCLGTAALNGESGRRPRCGATEREMAGLGVSREPGISCYVTYVM